MRRVFLAVAVALLVGAGGCSQPRSRVHGTVHYQGKPLSGATVIFLAPDNQAYPASTKADGSYEIAGVPRGQIRVSIQVPPPPSPPRPEPRAKGRDALAKREASEDDTGKKARLPPEPPGPPAARIPSHYGDPNRSGLSFELKSPEQEYPIDLK